MSAWLSSILPKACDDILRKETSRELRESLIGPVTAGSASNFDLAFFRPRPSARQSELRNAHSAKSRDFKGSGQYNTWSPSGSLSSVERGEFSVIAREPRGEHAMREQCAVQPFSEICLTIVGTTG